MEKVTVIGAGKYGSMTALRIAEYDIVKEVVMTDIVEGLPQGLALDINQSRFVEKFNTKLVGTNDYKDTAGSDVVVNTGPSDIVKSVPLLAALPSGFVTKILTFCPFVKPAVPVVKLIVVALVNVTDVAD